MRHSRIIIRGAAYHVTARTNRKEHLLGSALAKNVFLETLGQARTKYCFMVDNFVVMENHFHLLLQPAPTIALPDIMRWLLGVYTKKYNKIYKTCGHVWGARYFSRPIRTFRDYMDVQNYIDMNPVIAQLASRPANWAWNGLSHRKTGCYTIVDPLPHWLQSYLPEHAPLMLEGQAPALNHAE